MSIVQDIRSAFSRRDNALMQLILLNVLVFAGLIVLRTILTVSSASGYYPPVLRQLELSSSLPVLLRHPWTVLTYAFTHEGFFHILFNLLNLYWFGQLVREYLGDRRLVSIYVLGALAGAAIFLLSYNLIPAFQPAVGSPMIGASAAVTAIIVAGATLLPDFTFMLILIGPVKIKWIAAVVVLISLAGVNGGNPGGEIAHLGGALLGFVFIKQLQAGRDLGRPIQAVGNWVSNLFNRRPTMHVSTTRRAEPVAAASSGSGKKPAVANQPLQDEIDTILDKISRSGYESLSKEEKQKLFRASQQ
ncbi:rhomboid family intramembrane serine protease [Hymenobacter sp. BT770]|uniref:rhomboid family protein n=1 Tax=Hymenobacter sp. BT770 TaxID=2886942 RepID=UPI001D108837|nr:rhomboid family intramembrane serine protease [Hymenobacter sp. BT770]MCC3155101.1 rhomboid family intramembrane serine protease [Hymenobacter sp. BT770]MDO3417044.1 rhomboid family intramembrane serine protease [Hymenobacter sp. BT770]